MSIQPFGLTEPNAGSESTLIGHTPSFVVAADRIIVEVDYQQPRVLEQRPGVYQRDFPPNRDPIPIADPVERICSSKVTFDANNSLPSWKLTAWTTRTTFGNRTRST